MKKLFMLLILAGLFACSPHGDPSGGGLGAKAGAPRYSPPGANVPPLVFLILPVESAGEMYKRFMPLKYYLEKSLRAPVTIKIAKDYASAISEIGSGQVDMAYLDPAAYCEVRAQYKSRVVPLVRASGRASAASRSVLVAKAGNGIERVVDVRGKRMALGNKQSSFSYLIPLAMLNDVGIKAKDFASVDYLQQEDRIALSVLIGNHDIGALSESVAAKYVKDGLKIIKRSESVPQFVLCASQRLSPEKRDAVRKILVSLKGKGTLSPGDADTEFTAAEDRDFDMIRVMLRNITGRDYIEYGPNTIRVAVLPLYSAITIYNRYDPLMRYLSDRTGYQFKLVIPRDFDDFIRTVKSGRVDFSYQNPYIFALIDKEYDLKPLVTTVDEYMEKGDLFRGVIVTRTDSRISDVGGLRNRKVLITSPKSAGGYLSQRIFLMQMGIDTEKDMEIIDAKRQENAILGVYRREADAGFVREAALAVLKDEIDMTKIKVLARTSPLPNWPFALCRNTNPSLVGRVKRLLIELTDAGIIKAAEIKGFKEAKDSEFEALKKY